MMLLVFVGLIVAIQLFNQETVLLYPDDREQILAERADKENNAHYVLQEARDKLPSRLEPVAVPDDDYPDRKFPYQPLENEFSGIMGIQVPPDHPAMLHYLEESREAIDHARTALQRPYLRHPIPASHYNLRNQLPPNQYLGYLLAVWFAYGQTQITHWDDLQGGIQTLSDLWTVLSMFDTEPLVIHSRWQFDPFSLHYFKLMQRLIQLTDDPAVLDALDELLKTHPPMYEDLTNIFEAHMRALDDTMLVPELMESYGMPTRFDYDDRIEMYQLQLVSRWYVQHLEHFRDPDNTTPEAFTKWLDDNEWRSIPWTDYMDMHVTLLIQEEFRRAWTAIDAPAATRIAIALQRYKLEHDRYPRTLDKLVPDFIDTIPESRISDSAFHYSPGSINLDPPAYTLHGTSAPWFGGWTDSRQFVALEFIVEKDFY